jgi:NAD(P)-dependent dehydrogenase (short-subunit alcohol dehydrogenase family)
MGPAFAASFREHGAEVIEDRSDLTDPAAADAVVAASGRIDVLCANLAARARGGRAVVDIEDAVWSEMFEIMVNPLHRLVRAVLPQMQERRAGKILVVGSATGLKALPGASAYSAARSAQVGYVRSVGAEVAADNIQVNLIAQNFVENPIYFSEKFQQTEMFREMMRTVPAGRLATAEEDAMLAVFLASDESDFFIGQAIPFSGGWVQ